MPYVPHGPIIVLVLPVTRSTTAWDYVFGYDWNPSVTYTLILQGVLLYTVKDRLAVLVTIFVYETNFLGVNGNFLYSWDINLQNLTIWEIRWKVVKFDVYSISGGTQTCLKLAAIFSIVVSMANVIRAPCLDYMPSTIAYG